MLSSVANFQVDIADLESYTWKAEGDLVQLNVHTSPSATTTVSNYEHFKQDDNINDLWSYNFAYALFAFDDEKQDYASIRKEVIKHRKLIGRNESIVRVNITDFQRIQSPMRLILTDMTNYISNQPLLSLNLVLNDGSEQMMRIPAVFAVSKSGVPNHRQIDMPLPNVTSFAIEFNLKAMLPQ